ncbi:MAG: hypothetical protein OEW35_14760 [Gammaproteobacteria bacterium]|nr:hypothetical protein [Gammaproteobacteria bacterium]MDH4255914.1 hypothetical protein [Gammaproteobacteria bacterium]MDH5310968.1 hypothetical protein [Gammaproteobacteria bacterium]
MNLKPALAALALTSSAVVLAEGSGWSLASVDKTGYAEIVLALVSGDGILDENGRETVHPTLELYCGSGDPDGIGVRVDWRRFISSFSTEVGFKVGEGKRQWLKFGVDASNRVTLAKADSDTPRLLDLLGSGESLSVEVSPYSEAPVTVGFDLAGYQAALAELRAACR